MQRIELSEYFLEWCLCTECGMQTILDDVTLYEIINTCDFSNICSSLQCCLMVDHNLVHINIAKTKEKLLERINKEPPPNLSVNGIM